MDTSFINGLAASSTRSADSVQPSTEKSEGTFEALMLQLGCLHITCAVPTDTSAGDVAAHASGLESETAVVIPAALVPAQDGSQNNPAVRSHGAGTLDELLSVVRVPSTSEESAERADRSKNEKTKDAPDTVESDPFPHAASPPLPLPLEIRFGFASEGNQPPMIQNKETGIPPVIATPHPAQPSAAVTLPTIPGNDQPESTTNTAGQGPSLVTAAAITEPPADRPPVVLASMDVAQAAGPKQSETVDASVALPEETSTDAGTPSPLPQQMDGESAVASHKRGGRQTDLKTGIRLNTADARTDDAFHMVASPPSAARGERPVGGPLSVESPAGHIPQSPALQSPSSVYFEVQPPEAGRVRVHLALSEQSIYARVVTEQPEVQDYLLRNVGRLETQLQSYGLDVGRFHVEVDRHHQGRSQPAWTFTGERDTTSSDTSAGGESVHDVKPLEMPWHPHRVNLFV